VSKFAVGQVWAYHTRAGEESSRIRVLQVDVTAHAGVIVHVSVDGVSIHNPVNTSKPTQTIGFMPIAETALDASVTDLVEDDPNFVPLEDFD
jgi:hypothetical protein